MCLRKTLTVIFVFMSFMSFAQKVLDFNDHIGILAVDYYPFLTVSNNQANYGTVFGIRHSYNLPRGFIGSLDYLRTVATKVYSEKYWELTFLNFGKSINKGKRVQFPITASAGLFGYDNSFNHLGYNFGVHPSLRVFLTNKYSLRISSNFLYNIPVNRRNLPVDGVLNAWARYYGVGVEYNIYR